ncbi:insulin receptor substrate 1 isoform X1 [Drosophila guanche]|uniref:insulin receptor substrate 1 isoform X1 n=1 Tax=Drosophila guanche TaxID=7266 RepID=UPI0014717EC6|nr:insulin receptor substrate 1 isoform X1 [Drosophila guanche]XP_034129052.1 insulin receptor substrate 1 isoform X1 [Drosophila guanche]
MASTSDDGLVLSGYQKKLKTMKKKFFVLYEKTNNAAARLEYYDTEKKFLQKTEPKRVIYLSSCFNINPRFDTKHRFVIMLSSREGGFGIVLESDSDLRTWLEKLLFLQRHQANINGQMQSTYDHVWQVYIQKKGMSEKVGITGTYHCCLTSKSLTLVCIGPEKLPNGDSRISSIEILLTTIRRCGHAPPQCIFYMELGRQSVLGCGELWMETDNAAVATNMHNIILSAMSAKTETNMNFLNVYQARPDIGQEPMRKRSSSANESSKPIIQTRQSAVELRNSSSIHNSTYGRERCDSLPTRNRTLSDGSNQINLGSNHGFRSNTIAGNRPNTTNKPNCSPPFYTPLRCSESEESSISVDESDDNGTFTPYRRKFVRPIRAYSIGNKVEHSNLKRIGYINESGKNSHRVRAYSVGSKSKIPRCDLQRIVLVEKDKNKAGTNGSHNNIFTDNSIPSEVIHTNTIRENKSTSAPLLGLKHQVNTDRMSDLMEIDFSRTSILVKKKRIKDDDIPENIENGFSTYRRNLPLRNLVTTDPNVLEEQQINSEPRASDGGYLEMKPVGKTAYCESSVAFLQNKMDKIKLKDFSEPHIQDLNETRKTDNPNPSVIVEELQKSSLNEIGCQTMELTTSPDSNENLGLMRQRTNMNQEIESSKKNKPEFGTGDPRSVPDEIKFVNSTSNDEYAQVTGKISQFANKQNDVGYKIIHIKSDSSLISLKKNQVAIPNDDSEHRLQDKCIMVADKGQGPSSSNAKCNLKIKIADLKRTDASTISTILPIKNLNFPSDHTSRISHPELYYASLDLPHVSGKNTGAFLKRGSCESPPVALSAGGGNAYAKIDFDQSDSSSSSSNVVNA